MSHLDDSTSRLIANERAKLTASYVNGVAIAVLAVGGLALLFAQRAALSGPPDQPWLTPALSLLCICIDGVLTLGCTRISAGTPVMDTHTLTMLLFPIGALALGLGTLWFVRRAQ